MQKETRALNTATRGPHVPLNRQKMEQRASMHIPLPQLTSTVCNLELAGLNTFLVPLGGGHGCSERLHNLMEQPWSKVLLKGQENPKHW